ncbi:MAG TPA: hypothetical protein VJJ83_00740 [Candidatus Babeliales bacterium]|nr:hypothetical protein [Candidatus Babeliales bacterium]
MKNQFKFNRVFSVLMLSSIVMSSVPALAMDGLLEDQPAVALSTATAQAANAARPAVQSAVESTAQPAAQPAATATVATAAAKPSFLDSLRYSSHPRVYNGAAIAGAAALGGAGAYKLATAERTKKYIELGKKSKIGVIAAGGLTGAAVADLAIGTGATKAVGAAAVSGVRTAGAALADSRLGKAVSESRLGRAISEHPYAAAGITAAGIGAGVVGYKLYQKYRKPAAPAVDAKQVKFADEVGGKLAVSESEALAAQAPAQPAAPAVDVAKAPATTQPAEVSAAAPATATLAKPMSRKAKQLIGASAAGAAAATAVAVADLRYNAGLTRGAGTAIANGFNGALERAQQHPYAAAGIAAGVLAASGYALYRYLRPGLTSAQTEVSATNANAALEKRIANINSFKQRTYMKLS